MRDMIAKQVHDEYIKRGEVPPTGQEMHEIVSFIVRVIVVGAAVGFAIQALLLCGVYYVVWSFGVRAKRGGKPQHSVRLLIASCRSSFINRGPCLAPAIPSASGRSVSLGRRPFDEGYVYMLREG